MTNPVVSRRTSAPAFSHKSLLRNRTEPKTVLGMVMTALVFACAAIALFILAAVLYYIIFSGLGRFNLELFTELPPPPLVEGGGFGNAFVGTLITVGVGAIFSIPFGILAAIFLSEFARDSRIASIVDFANNVLSGVPSIVIGVFAYGIIVLTTGTFSAVAGGAALAVLMLPIVVRTAVESLESVSNETKQAAIGLGATEFQTITRVVLPAAIPAIITGVMLAIARAAGETAPLLFTALFSQYWVANPWQPIATLSVLIYNFAIAPYQNQQQLAWAAALVLLILVLVTNITARWITRQR